MLRYTFSILMLLVASRLMAQPDLEQPRDSVSGKSGLRIGIDLARYVERVINPEIRGIEVLSQYEMNNNWYLTAEGGYEVTEPEFENYNYSLNGGFLKLGVDYDFLDNPYDYDIFYLGMHYGLSLYQQQATDVPIESYWGNEYSGS
ncbi:MAG: DUF6048 family protein [Owenweeksia sp.]|nr:DUF6048 family protein [Owenweeksia sp.]